MSSRALVVGGWALAQLWMFCVAPIVGAVIGASVYRWVGQTSAEQRLAVSRDAVSSVT